MKTQACSTVVGEAKCDYLTSAQQSPALFLLEYLVILLKHVITKYVPGHKRTRFSPDTIVTT